MAEHLSSNLLGRIRDRLQDDWRRTGEGDWQRTPRDRRRRQDNPSLVGSLLQHVFDSAVDSPPDQPLKPLVRLSESAVAKVEKQLGFRLPRDLRQLYTEVADGNFGPFFGIRRLSNWAKDYLKLVADLEAERGHPWPAQLLPLVFLNGRRICLDRDSGEVVLWDRPAKRCSARKWQASFVPQSASLEEWLERWVDTPTVCEGGPPGGWSPPEAELERRSELEAARLRREAAAAERAARIEFTQLPPLDEALLHRVAEKAGHPERRTHGAGIMAGSQPLDIEGLARSVEANAYLDPKTRGMLSGMARGVSRLSSVLGLPGLRTVADGPGFVMGFEGAGGELGRPAKSAAVAKAEQSLGFALPEQLRQLYDLADGGFGPGMAGLLPLAQMAKRYLAYTGKPQGPNDEPWPARLLPLAEDDPAVYCLDLQDGSIVRHDVQEMDHLGRGQWERSFRREATSLAEWLEAWLTEPSFAEQQEAVWAEVHARQDRRGNSPVTGFPMQFDDAAEQAEGEIAFLEFSPDLRNDFGLPETGWQEEVRRRHGLPPS